MSDGDALLAAIAAHPDDDTPRLVYADWLDEHDDAPGPAGRASSSGGAGPGTNAIRAEFIRVQVAVRRLEDRPASEQREHVHLWRRQQELLDNHRRDLLAPFTGYLGTFDVVFDRGFVSELNLNAFEFLKHLAEVAALRPAPRVRLTCFGRGHVPALVVCPEARCIEALTVCPIAGECPEPIPDPVFGLLGNAPHLARVEVLDLSSMLVSDPELVLLLNGSGLPRLAELDLEKNEITDAGLQAIVASPKWAQLRRIDLSRNELSDAAAEILLAAPPSPLEHLNLRMNQIGPAVYPQLLERFGGRIDLF